MADAVDERSEAETVVSPPAPARRRRTVYGARFVLAHVLLVVVFGGVIALFAFLVSRTSESQTWSTYRPAGEGIDRAQNIANHVGRRYLDRGQMIAAIEAQPPIVQNTLVDAIAIAREPSAGVGGGYERVEPADSTIVYVFCGYGTRCAVPGSPTLERGWLLRRESLELALYTFKYLDDIKAVVTLLPPSGRTIPAVYLRRSSVREQLKKPLLMTLPASGPFATDRLPDAQASERLTAARFFRSEFQSLPNGRALLVLTKTAQQ
jgi:hypothetical protein